MRNSGSLMQDRSSPVCGSMIWYSSSMPMVSSGGVGMRRNLRELSRLDHKGRDSGATARRHVEQRVGGDAGEAAGDVVTVADEGRGVQHPLADAQAPVHQAR